MPAVMSGRIAKAQRGKKPPGQQHQKNHRWESFSSKIAKLHSLDPLRRVRRHDLDEATAGDVSTTTSFFRNGLDKWADLNLSRIFTAFRRAVQPLSESLPQIVHFEDRIMAQLEAAIREAQVLDDEREALEPLLDLLTAFAHDLGTRFVARGFDARAFALLVAVARHNSGAGRVRSHHQQNHLLDAAVIEWTFAALAFLFKYLARLLVPDLRPTYDILAPLLGSRKTEDEKEKKSEKDKKEEKDGEKNKKNDDENIENDTPKPIEPRFPARVPGHIARFAAEAMSFLIKKAAAPSHRETALSLIVEHARDDLLRAVAAAQHKPKNKNSTQLFTQGLMTLFAESIKGTGTAVQSSGPELFVALLRAIPDNERIPDDDKNTAPPSTWSDLCCGVLTSIVHHASPEALQPVVDAIVAEAAPTVEAVAQRGSTVHPWRLSVYVRLVGVLAGVRRGAKVHDWPALVLFLTKTLEAMATAAGGAPEQPEWSTQLPPSLVWQHIGVHMAIVWSQAPVDALIPCIGPLTQVVFGRAPLAPWFIPFCAYLADLQAARFRELLLRPFVRFVAGHWSAGHNEDVLCALLPRMVAAGAFASSSVSGGGFSLPQSWQDQIVSQFEQLEATPFPERGVYDKDPDTWRDRCLPRYAALLGVLDVPDVSAPTGKSGVSSAAGVHPSTRARIAELLLRKLRLALRPTSPALANSAETVFVVTQGFQSYLRMTRALASTPDAGLRVLLRAAAPRFARRTAFLEALLQYEEAVGAPDEKETPTAADSDADKEEDPLVQALVANLSATSHRLRLVSLQILERIATPAPPALATMLQIEQIPFDPHNTRSIAVHLRKLAIGYSHVTDNTWMQAAIPAFLFGMLSVPLSPVWDDATEAMKQVAQANKAGEEAVAQLALEWLDVPSPRRQNTGLPAWMLAKGGAAGGRRAMVTDFECFNYARLIEQAAGTEQILDDPAAQLRLSFEEKQEAVPVYGGMERGKALKVLAAMPGVAEKRSRRLVPHLLSWTEDDGGVPVEDESEVEEEAEGEEGEQEEDEEPEKEPDHNVEGEEEGEEGGEEIGGWSFADKKALVVVFSQFSNGRALYQSERAYEALLRLMGNGDSEIQRLALKGLLAWRQAGLMRHRESLEALLDEAKFKNELTLLQQQQQGHGEEDDGSNRRILATERGDVMPVLLRLLYGRAISKKGAASGRQGLHATRLFVLRSLDRDSMGGFLQISLGSLQHVRVLDSRGVLRESLFADGEAGSLLTARKQVGVLNMLESIVGELGAGVVPYLDALVNATLYCLIMACRGLQDVPDAVPEGDGDSPKSANTSLLRVAKTTALRCMCALFQHGGDYDWTPYRAALVGEVISPVIERLPQETTQGVSWTWKLLGTWAQMPSCALFLAVDKRVLPKMLESVALAQTRDAVKIYALGIVGGLVKMVTSESAEATDEQKNQILADLLLPNMDAALGHLGHVLQTSSAAGADISRPLLEACVDTVVALSALVQASAHVRRLVDIATWLLNQPSRRVNPRVKGALLLLLERFIRLGLGEEDQQDQQDQLNEKVFSTIAALFSFFKDRENRLSLCRVLAVFAETTAADSGLVEVARLCFDLNAYAEGHVDEPDYDRRLAAFSAVVRPADADAAACPRTTRQWLPLLHNMLFFLRVDEEFGVLATNAADGICKFVTDAAAGSAEAHQPQDAYAGLLQSIVLPAIYAGARDPSETVRREVARVFGFLIGTLRAWPPVASLAPLVPEVRDRKDDEGDDDAAMDDVEVDERESRAFFSNILSPALAKQIQAMQVLEGANARCPLGSRPVSQFFIPLLEQFIFGREDGTDDHGLGAQATNTIGQLAGSLEWNQYRAVLRRFLSFVESKPTLQKQVVRLLDRVVEALVVARGERGEAGEEEGKNKDKKIPLAATLPDTARFTDEVLSTLTPVLVEHLHDKDEATVSERVPVGVVVVKLLNLLPRETRDSRLAGVLTDICHILRSRAWESREMARDTLVRILGILGPSCFGFVLQELRGALTRGYQLHVLSYTMHSLLLTVVAASAPGDLDYCVEPIVAVIMDDVFGVTGQEKDADEYTSKMKEVKSSKSQDSMELMAKTVSIGQLAVLVQPLRALLLEKVDLTVARKIDVLLGRISSGLVQNPAANSRDSLVFGYEVVQDVYKSQKDSATPAKMDGRTRRYLYQKSLRNNVGARQASRFTYKLVRFALDVLRAVLRKFDGLRTPENVAGLVPLLGDAVTAGEEEVQVAALKLLVVLVKVPFADAPSARAFSGLYRVATKEAIQAVATATSTAGERAQAALKLVAAVLRDRAADDVPVRDAAVDVLLGRLRDDLTEPALRHVTFAFLRAVLDRRVETAAVYDVLDYVGTVMVTNDDRDTRDLARGAFFQFVREYPQRRARWQAQLAFVVANLQYDRAAGRLSVMEMVHLLLLKAPDAFVEEIVGACFVPLVVVLANDDAPACRRIAAELLRALLRRAARPSIARFLALFRTWLAADAALKPAVLKLGLQAFGIYFGSWDKDDLSAIQADAQVVLDRIADVLQTQKDAADAPRTEIVAVALQTVQVLLEQAPALALDGTGAQTLWPRVENCLWNNTGSVRLAAMRLVEQYLADFDRKAAGGTVGTVGAVMTGSYGLTLGDADVTRLVLGCLSVLSGRGGVDVDEAEAEEAARMLVRLGQHLAVGEGEEGEEKEGEKKGEEEGSDEEEDSDEEDTADKRPKNARLDRPYVFRRLARVVRRETPPVAAALVPKAAAMAVLEAYCRQKTAGAVIPPSAARAVLRPLRNLTDPSIAAPASADPLFGTRYEALRQRAHALMDVLQTRLGTAAYTQLLLAVGAAARDRRQQRASKRKIGALAQPEKHGRDKRKRLEKKKERRKVRGLEHRSHRRGE